MTETSTFRIPHTLALLFFLMIAALVATWLVPQGFFAEDPDSGRVVPGSYEVVADREVLSPLALFTAIPRAFVDAGPIIFFLFIIGGVLAIIRATGTIDALLGRLLERFRDRPRSLIFAVIFVFSLASSAVGSSGEYIPFVLILVALCRAMRMDAMTAVGMVVAGYGVGYGLAAFNQYTVVVAQEIAELPTYSGWWLRLALLVPAWRPTMDRSIMLGPLPTRRRTIRRSRLRTWPSCSRSSQHWAWASGVSPRAAGT